MIGEVFKEIFAFIGMLTVLVAVLGIILNEIVWGNWYGETEEQRRARRRRERRATAARWAAAESDEELCSEAQAMPLGGLQKRERIRKERAERRRRVG